MSNIVKNIRKEQSSAKGDFPGPCPIVFAGASNSAADAIAAGAAGVVLGSDEREMALGLEAEIVWRVGSAEDVANVVEDELAPEDVFLFDGAQAPALLGALPTGAIGVAALEAMQPDDGEIETGRELASSHKVKAIVLRSACVGDVEDLPYAKYAVKQLTSKKSSSFAIDGHTGSVNGHFGGSRGASAARPEDGWARVRGR